VTDEVEIILYVADQARSAAFYATAFERDPVVDVPGMTSFALLPGVRIGLMPNDDAAEVLGSSVPTPSLGSGIPRAEIYLVVEDGSAAVERLRAAGGLELSPLTRRPWGDTAGYFADPDGHVIAIAERGDRP
jgi:lactoylglutathione lyase